MNMDWQPIETAPRDGTRILLYRPLAERTNDDPIDIKRGVPRDSNCWEETIPPGMDATNYTDGACKATHWMPLPLPPNVQAQRTLRGFIAQRPLERSVMRYLIPESAGCPANNIVTH
jgi:hypothetical protein